jgi:hypothetical protein
MTSASTLVCSAVVLLAVGGCQSESEPEIRARKADLADIGVHPHPSKNYVDVVDAKLCDGDDVSVVTLNLAAGQIGIKYV